MKKTNRTFKRFAAITSASLLAACAVAPVAFNSFAADTVLTMSAPSSLPDDAIIDNTVKAYKIFEITKVNGTEADYNIDDWATGVNFANLITALKSDVAFGEDESNIFNGVNYDSSDETTKVKSAKALAVALSNLDDDQKIAFAKVVMNNVSAEPTITGSYSNGNVTFSDIGDGYYIMTCTALSDDETPNYESISLGMLTVVDGAGMIGLTGQAKVGLPTVEKKVQENVKSAIETFSPYETDAKWNEVADYNIGDPVPFKLYGTMPSDLSNYESYYYKFTDNLGTQFTFDENSVVVKVKTTTIENNVNVEKEYIIPSSVEVNSTTYTNYSIGNPTDTNIRTFEFKDIKNLKDKEGHDVIVNSSSVITVQFNATLNNTANIGLPGQENSVKLTYSNNPNFDYNPGDSDNTNDSPSTDDTPEEKVIVYTYEIDVTKQFVKADGTPADNPSDINNMRFTLTKDGESDPIKFVLHTDGYYYPATAFPSSATSVSALSLNSDNKILIKGLDDGEYKLNETVKSSEFNGISEQTITITAGTVHTQSWNGEAKTGLTTFDSKSLENANNSVDCILDVDVTNTKGSSLPSTGGIGTTIFYLGGGAMAAIGGVYLISKRRMKKSEE